MVSWSTNDAAAPARARKAGSGRAAGLSPTARPRGREVRRDLWRVGTLVSLSCAFFLVFVALAAHALLTVGWAMLPFVLMIAGLFYCALAYQVIRLGAARRGAQGAPAAADPSLLGADAPSVTVLIPSYRESRRVVIETVLSAALARYRKKRIVVLVDDPPDASEALAETLGAIETVKVWMAEAAAICDAALAEEPGVAAYVRAHEALAGWLSQVANRLRAEGDPSFRHVDRFVLDRVVLELARHHRRAAQQLRTQAMPDLDAARDAIAAVAAGEIVSFQRKQFANLSHGANKAMNLNAYLGLMGGDWQISCGPEGRRLRPAPEGQADLAIPQSDYVLTLDADSVIVADYILTLVGVLEDSPRAAVAQTPYLTFPEGGTPVERIAGATTDIQYLIHQGSSHYGAAYWVGANAVIRTRALQDILRTRQEGDTLVKVFVQDKTVIEDTGSTIDLQDHGWHVHNHFDPMAYSATPADFGALAIQRKRWANGGLILFFDLLRSHRREGARLTSLPRLLVRSHYLLSPLIGNCGILALMLMSTDTPHAMFWTPLFMAPYFVLYMLDLQRMGYCWWNLFGVCALNLMLLPVNLAGILASIWQMAGGPRHNFMRTPKVASRSFIPPYAFLFNLAVLCLMAVYVALGLRNGQLAGTVIPLINIGLYGYGLIRFVGVRDGFNDLALRLRQLTGAALRPLWRVAAPSPQPHAPFTLGSDCAPLPLTPAPEETR